MSLVFGDLLGMFLSPSHWLTPTSFLKRTSRLRTKLRDSYLVGRLLPVLRFVWRFSSWALEFRGVPVGIRDWFSQEKITRSCRLSLRDAGGILVKLPEIPRGSGILQQMSGQTLFVHSVHLLRTSFFPVTETRKALKAKRFTGTCLTRSDWKC